MQNPDLSIPFAKGICGLQNSAVDLTRLAHDFANHLQTIGGYLDLALLTIPDERTVQYLQIAKRSSIDATRLTAELRELAQNTGDRGSAESYICSPTIAQVRSA